MKKDYHKEAIELLLKAEVSFQNLVIEIAKHNPAALCKAYNSLNPISVKIKVLGEKEITVNDYNYLKYLTDSKKYITAVKEYRRITGAGLKESRDAIEAEFGWDLH